MAQIALAAVVGGTVSELSGGKFANGAVTAAMQFALNQMASSATRSTTSGNATADTKQNLDEEDEWQFPGTDAGERAVMYWAQKHIETGNPLYAVLGSFAALWTPETYLDTALTLVPGLGLGCWAARPYWQYFPIENPAYSSSWFTRGWGWQPPFRVGAEAREALALAPWNAATGVRSAKPSGYIHGPRRVQPQPQWDRVNPRGYEYRTKSFRK